MVNAGAAQNLLDIMAAVGLRRSADALHVVRRSDLSRGLKREWHWQSVSLGWRQRGGAPTRYMVGKDTSGDLMQQRLGRWNSLPLICDEITQKNPRTSSGFFPGRVRHD